MNNPLQDYIDQILKPTLEQKEFLNSKIRTIQSLFEHNSNLNLKECRPAGSFHKGTMLQYNPELDIVLVLNKEKGRKINFQQVLQESERLLRENVENMIIKKVTKISIKAEISDNNKRKYGFDIVPTFWVNSPVQVGQVKNSLAYQGITSIWNNFYVLSQNKNYDFYQELVLLLKDWKNEHDLNIKSYIIELIVASALKYREIEDENPWEEDLIECFKEIISMIDGSPIFPINWKYFDEEKDLDKFKSDRIIIDPADPTVNLANDIREESFKILKSEATRALNNIKVGNYDAVFNYKRRLEDYSWE